MEMQQMTLYVILTKNEYSVIIPNSNLFWPVMTENYWTDMRLVKEIWSYKEVCCPLFLLRSFLEGR